MTALLTADLVVLDQDLGADPASVLRHLTGRVAAAGRSQDPAGLHADAMAREAQSATGLPGGIGIPHCRSAHVTEATLAFARLQPPADFGAPDGPADLVFLIAAPEGGGAQHMKLLSSLARALVKPEFTAALRGAGTADEVVRLVQDVVTPVPAAAGAVKLPAQGAPAAAAPTSTSRTVVAVTACPTGIAHTYMAADSLVAAGKRAGVDVQVETQGSSGSTPLSAATIAGAAAVIFATDVGVKERERFAGKPVVASGVKRAINEPDLMLTEALAAADDPSSAKVEGTAGAAAAGTSTTGSSTCRGASGSGRSCSPA